MDPIFPQPGHTAALSLPVLPVSPLPVSALPAGTAPVGPAPGVSEMDRISRLAALGPEDTVAGLLWLAMNFPAVCDAMLDKTEFDAVDDEYPCQEPELFCDQCGASIGIFLRSGRQWQHYHGDGISQIEVFDPGHCPVVAWRVPATL